MSKKANHQVNIVRISEVKKHPNADKLELVYFTGSSFQCVSQIGTFTPGDFAVYIQPDSIVPQTEPFRFIWGSKAVHIAVEPTVQNPEGIGDTEVLPRYRRITAKRLRGEWSEGLLMPASDFFPVDAKNHVADFMAVTHGGEHSYIQLGADVSDMLGVTHYAAEVDGGKDLTFAPKAKKTRRPKTVKGWFWFLLHKFKITKREDVTKIQGPHVPVYDLDGFKNYPNTFEDGEIILVTEKIHGSSARYMYFDGELYVGSRNHWVDPNGGLYPALALKDNPWIRTWCEAHEGFSLYGEVTPTQKGYSYSLFGGFRRFWVFDIRDAECNWIDKDSEEWLTIPVTADLAPMLYQGPYDEAIIKKLVDGKTVSAGQSHIREGIVIEPVKVRYTKGLGRVKLKLVSNAFLEKDSSNNVGVTSVC